MTSAFLTLTKGEGHTTRSKVTYVEVSAFSECFLFIIISIAFWRFSLTAQLSLTLSKLKRKYYSMCGLAWPRGLIRQLWLPDKRVDLGCWLRSGLESPQRQLVSCLFQNPISYGRFNGATLYVPCLDWGLIHCHPIKSGWSTIMNIWSNSRTCLNIFYNLIQ